MDGLLAGSKGAELQWKAQFLAAPFSCKVLVVHSASSTYLYTDQHKWRVSIEVVAAKYLARPSEPFSYSSIIIHLSLGILISIMQVPAPSLMQAYPLECNSEPRHISPFIHHDAGPSSSPNIHLSSSKLSTLLCSFCVSNWCKAARQSAAFSQSCFVLCDGHPHEGHVSFCAGACSSRPSAPESVRCLLWL